MTPGSTGRAGENPVLKAARDHLTRGWLPIPIPRGEKAPLLRSWQKLRLTETELARYFDNGSQNIGLLLGEPSGGLLDVDLDALEAVAAAPEFLPPTPRVHGRPGKPRSHWWYIAEPVPSTTRWKDTDGTTLCELRSTGAQTVVPPSIHPSGEELVWSDSGDPSRITRDTLHTAAASVASCALLARHWPEQGGRHDAALAVAGLLLRGALEERRVVTLVEAAARIARDEEWNARGDDVRDTARKLRAGGPATGAPSLARVLRDGDRVVGLLRLWLCLQPVVTDGKQYSVTADGLVWHRPERLPVPLTNFKAQIVADVVEDDGAETRRLFLIEAGLNGRHTRIKVPAAEFSAMTWPTEHLGATAVVYPGQGVRDHARAAIQLLSDEPPERRVYTHLGWRLTDGRWIYLHAGGAIGPEGAIAEIEVAPPEALNHFRLPVPPTGVDLVDALRASVTFLDVAPDAITVPVFAAIWRAVLGSADFSVHLAGPTGVGKTELAALAQQHFGADLHARHLPASWASTGNALEGLAFAAKDALLVVDDYSGAAGDVQRLQREADRLLRAQGNSLGRQRMRPDATLKPPKPPRGLILSTGEDVPHGHSLRARLLILQVGPNAVNWSRLTAAQQEATAGRFASALAAFVRWLAPRYTELRNRSLADVAQRRQTAVPLAQHRRTPGIVGGLEVALGVFLEFAESVGAMGHEELAALANRARTALSAAGAEQSELHAANEVTRRFLALVGAAVAGGRAHVAGAEGEAPPDPEGWGWRQVMIGMPLSQRHEWRPQGERAGWIDSDDLYLEPDVAFAIAQRLARDAEEPLVISPSTLKRRLLERGLLKSADRARMVYTVRRTLNRVRREVLHLSGDVLSLSIEKPDQPDHADARSDAGREPPAAAPLGPTTKRNDFHETSPLLVGLVGSNEQDTGRGIGEHDDGSATPPTTIATPPTAGPRDRKDLEDRPAGGAPHPDNLQQPLGPCPACAGTRFWRSVAGVVVCATCHPPAFDSLVAGWLDAARADTGGGGAHATPKEGDPGC